MWELAFAPEIVNYFSNGKGNTERQALFHDLIEKYKSMDYRCLQVGVPNSMNQKYGRNFIAVDLYDKRDCIDMRCDLTRTPFENSTFDFIVCAAVLEHVKNPFACIAEMTRILKPDGEIYLEVPFVQSYHPFKGWANGDKIMQGETFDLPKDENHGGDYWRFTPQGIFELAKPLVPIKIILINEGGISYYGRKEA